MNRVILSLLLCVALQAATTDTVHIQEDGGGDWTTLTAAENGEDRNITTSDEVVVLQLEEAWTNDDYDTVTVDGWTTDSDNYIVIQTDATARHPGTFSTTDYRLVVTNLNCLVISENYVRVDGIQIKSVITGSTSKFGVHATTIASGGSDIRISDSLIVGSDNGGTGNGKGYQNSDADATVTLINCIAYSFKNGDSGTAFWAEDGTTYLYNCTVVNSDRGFGRNAGSYYVFNCLANDCEDGYAGSVAGGSNNCSDIVSDALGTSPVTGEVTFVSETDPVDYHLASGDTVAKNAGVSDPGSGLYSDDIDGVARSGSWDIGADEYVSAGTVNPQVIIITTQ